MKRKLSALLAVALVCSIILGGCGSTSGSASSQEAAASSGSQESQQDTSSESSYKVAMLVNGTLGDQGFWDDSASGIDRMTANLGVEGKIVEAGYDTTKWLPSLQDLADEDYDIIIVGSFNMVDYLQQVAKEHPEKKFIIFDSAVDYSSGDYANVYSIIYSYNEASFLVGALGAMVTTSDLEYANPEKVISFVGGQDTPVINDFLVGYIEGAQYIDPDVKVAVSYIGSYDDAAKGKEIASAQVASMNVDYVYPAAGGAGLGSIDGATENNAYAIGMTVDQAALYKDSDPDKANKILTSMLGFCGLSIYHSVEKAMNGELEWGTTGYLGIADDAVGICENDIYTEQVPQEFRDKIAEIIEDVKAGKISISSAQKMSTDETAKIIESAAP